MGAPSIPLPRNNQPTDSQCILILVKPGGVGRRLVGETLGRIEAKGYKLGNLRFMRMKEGVLRVYYAHLADKPFFLEIVRYMTRGPVAAAAFSGASVIGDVRILAGATNPT